MRSLILTAIFVMIPMAAWAKVPHVFTMQSMVYDKDGNITSSDVVGVTIEIKDEYGNVVYGETHTDVPVIKGAISLIMGSMREGGIVPDVLDPGAGQKFIDVAIDGANPFDPMPLTAVPYAMWADKALAVADDVIESRHIKDGGIGVEDLAPGIAFSDLTGTASDEQIPATVARDANLKGHIDSASAHGARAISVSGNFQTMVAASVEEALEKIDSKLADEMMNRRGVSDAISGQLAKETLDRKAGDTALQNSLNMETQARAAADTALQDEKVSRGEDAMLGDLTVPSLNVDGPIWQPSLKVQGDVLIMSGRYMDYGSIVFRPNADNQAGDDDIIFLDDTDSVVMEIDRSGNVGIGTSDPGGDKLDVRGRAYASGGWQAVNGDYAEWFEAEGAAVPGDIIGINLETGRARRYIPGDRFVGILSGNPAFVGNRMLETEEEMSKAHLLVGLLGQMNFNRGQVLIEGRIVKTQDSKEIGVLLADGRVLVGR